MTTTLNWQAAKCWPLLALLALATSCATVKPHEKAYINDGEMELAMRKLEKLETSFQLYREGSAGATGGKSGGGCGCN